MLLYGDLWDLEAGLMRKSAAHIRSACNGLFPFPEGKKCEKKETLSQGFGGFSLEGKVCGRASRLCPLHYRLHCEYKGHILFTFERAHVFLTIYCMELVRVNKE